MLKNAKGDTIYLISNKGIKLYESLLHSLFSRIRQFLLERKKHN